MKKLKLDSQLTVPVKVTFDILPPMMVQGSWLPAQVDITQVDVEIPDNKGKPRKVNLLPSLDESTIMALEDEIILSLQAP